MKRPAWLLTMVLALAGGCLTLLGSPSGAAQQPGSQISSGQPAPRTPLAQTMKAALPAIPEVVCRPSSQSAGLSCKPSGKQTCPAEVLYQPGVNSAVKACPAVCVPQSMSAGTCDCTFNATACSDRPGR